MTPNPCQQILINIRGEESANNLKLTFTSDNPNFINYYKTCRPHINLISALLCFLFVALNIFTNSVTRMNQNKNFFLLTFSIYIFTKFFCSSFFYCFFRFVMNCCDSILLLFDISLKMKEKF